MEQTIRELKEFLDGAHSTYHAIEGLVWQLEAAGYTPLYEADPWELLPGGKYYMTRGDSALMAFRIPVNEPAGFMMTASHSDRPCFKVKENGVLEGKYTRLSVERYGGMLIAPWLDRVLSIAGRVTVQTAQGVENRLIDLDRDLLVIPNVAIHMNREINDGYKWNPAVDVLPLMGTEGTKDGLWRLIEQEAGGKVLGHDLYLYVREQARVWGLEDEFISAAALDDLACAWCCTKGFLNAVDSDAISVLCVFDSEEVGSVSNQGAGANILQSTLKRICRSLDLEYERMLASSFMVSADNAHALHPNHPEYSDSQNAPVLNGGPVVKFNSNMRYTTDGVSAALLRQAAANAGVPLQTYYNRADLLGGSTLGNISLGQVSVLSVDMGLPQLAMHSCFETCGVHDVTDCVELMTALYSCTLEREGDNAFILR